MIILKSIGGLGNQMFEIAFARMISLEYGDDIYIDCSVYKKYKIRKFSILNLNIGESIKFIDQSDLKYKEKIYLKITQKIYHVYQKIVKIITNKRRIGNKSFSFLSKLGLYYNFDDYYYDFVKSNSRIKCIYGYFQSEKYFEKYKSIIRNELKVKKEVTSRERELLKEIQNCNSVGVSIRIGDDYVNSNELNVCSQKYYYEAMDKILEKNEDVVFYIFSDSIEKVKEKFNFKYKVKYIEGFNDYESLRLLYNCKDFIISNSSFSWWGAYLSDNEEKVIIAPSKWYNNSEERPDIYLKEMVLIEI